MATFLLVRHGTTDWVEKNILHGITDIPLSKKGKMQAQETARVLRGCGAKKLYTSSLSRCVQTAQAISNEINVEPIPMDNLVELNFGWREGKPLRDYGADGHKELRGIISHHIENIIRIVTGESLRKFDRRVLEGWSSIVSENPSGTVIVVAHSAVFNRILFHNFGKKHLDGKPYHHLNPCSITEININQSNPAELVRLNDYSHLSIKNQ